MKRKRRFVLISLVILLWCAPLAIGIEVWTRYRANAIERGAAPECHQRSPEDAARDEAVWLEYATSRPAIGADMADRRAFVAMAESDRAAFAAEKGQTVLICDADAVITSVYCAQEPEGIRKIGHRARIGVSLSSLFAQGAPEGGDCLAALAEVCRSGNPIPREYGISDTGSDLFQAQFFFYPMSNEGGSVRQVGVFIRASMWKVLWQEFQPNVDQNDFYVFHSNNVGFRGPDVLLPKPAGVFRVICVGGSTTVEGETGEMTYPAILEKKLRRHFRTDAIEVINGGIFGMNSGGEINRLPDYLALQPDLIVHYNLINDLRDHLPAWMAPRPGSPADKLKGLLRKSRFIYDHCNGWFLPPDAELKEQLDRTTLSNLRKLVDAAQVAQVGVALCSFARPDAPHLSRQDRRLFNSRINTMMWGRLVDIDSYWHIVGLYNGLVNDLCAEESLVYIPVGEGLLGGSRYFSDICHLYPCGIERKAAIIADALTDYIAPRLGEQR